MHHWASAVWGDAHRPGARSQRRERQVSHHLHPAYHAQGPKTSYEVPAPNMTPLPSNTKLEPSVQNLKNILDPNYNTLKVVFHFTFYTEISGGGCLILAYIILMSWRVKKSAWKRKFSVFCDCWLILAWDSTHTKSVPWKQTITIWLPLAQEVQNNGLNSGHALKGGAASNTAHTYGKSQTGEAHWDSARTLL